MNKMVEKYAYNRDVFSQELLDSDCSERGRGDAAVLTGATGSLGAHILYQLCLSSTLSKIYCMVRASDRDSATERVMKGLGDRGLSIPDSRMADVVCLPAVLEENHCGLKEDMYNEIKNRVGLVIHSAWPVNFLAPLQSFEPQFQGQ